jgi:hypothetical protein
MPGRGRQTFNKNQKEQKRREKQQAKVAKRVERKLNPTLGPSDEMPEWLIPEDSESSEHSAEQTAEHPADRTE